MYATFKEICGPSIVGKGVDRVIMWVGCAYREGKIVSKKLLKIFISIYTIILSGY
jgi:hypothetical protein